MNNFDKKKIKETLHFIIPCATLFAGIFELYYETEIAKIYWVSYLLFGFLFVALILSLMAFIKAKETIYYVNYADYEKDINKYENNSLMDNKMSVIYRRVYEVNRHFKNSKKLLELFDIINRLNLSFKSPIDYQNPVVKKEEKEDFFLKNSKFINLSLIILFLGLSLGLYLTPNFEVILFTYVIVLFIYLSITSINYIRVYEYDIKSYDKYKSRKKMKKYTEILAYATYTKEFIVLSEFEINLMRNPLMFGLNDEDFFAKLEKVYNEDYTYLKDVLTQRKDLYEMKVKNEITSTEYFNALSEIYEELVKIVPFIIYDYTFLIKYYEEKYEIDSETFKNEYLNGEIEKNNETDSWFKLIR